MRVLGLSEPLTDDLLPIMYAQRKGQCASEKRNPRSQPRHEEARHRLFLLYSAALWSEQQER